MSIKHKKPIQDIKNAHRIRKITHRLISEGYVNVNPNSEEYQRWVDCVSHGLDIRFRLSKVTKDAYSINRELQSLGGYGKDGYFTIENSRTRNITGEAYTIEDAIKQSRAQIITARSR